MYFFIKYYNRTKKANTILKNQVSKRVGTLEKIHFNEVSSTLTAYYRGFRVKIYTTAVYLTGEQIYFLVSFGKILENSITIKYRNRLSTASQGSTKSGYIETGNPEFDVLYKVIGKNPKFTTDMLTADIQKNLLETKNYKPFIELEGDNLKLVVQNFVLIDEDFDKLIEVVLKFIDRLIELKVF